MRAAKILPVVGALLITLWLSPIALAHAQYVSSNPANGVQMGTAPANVSITFDDDLDPNATSIVVTGPDGQAVTNGKAVVTVEAPKVAIVPIKAVGAGAYTVKWHAVADDDKAVTEGTFGFTVGAPAKAGVAAAVPAPTGAKAAGSGLFTWTGTTQLVAGLLVALVIAIFLSMQLVRRR